MAFRTTCVFAEACPVIFFLCRKLSCSKVPGHIPYFQLELVLLLQSPLCLLKQGLYAVYEEYGYLRYLVVTCGYYVLPALPGIA